MSGIVPPWLQHWLGIEATNAGEGVSWSIDGSWGWAPWITLLFAMFAVAWVAYFYAREISTAGRGYRTLLAGMRLGMILLLVLMIAELMLSLRRTGLPTVVVLVDDSASMGIVDRYDDEQLRALVAQRLKAAGFASGPGKGAAKSSASGADKSKPGAAVHDSGNGAGKDAGKDSDAPAASGASSAALRDGGKAATRLNLAKSLLVAGKNPILDQIQRNYKLRVYAVSTVARSLGEQAPEIESAVKKLDATGQSTRLGAALRGVLGDLRGTPPAAIVLVSDGVSTDGETLADAAKYVRRKGTPLFTVGLGNERPVRDLEISDLLVDEVVFVDDIVNFEFKLTGVGLAGRNVDVVLREKDRPRVLARLKAVVGADGKPQRLQMPYRPTETGDFEYVVEALPVADEIQSENNHQARVVSVRKEQIRALFAQAYPSNEFRYLKHMLERDGTVQLRTVLQDADVEYAELDQSALPIFPVRRDELFEYDCLILGDVNPTLLSASSLENIQAFVENKGGGVAFIAGPLYMPLAYRGTALEPLFPIELGSATAPPEGQVITEGFAAHPTDMGLTSPQMQLGDSLVETTRIWRDLPPLYWLLETPTLKPAARVLAEHPERTGPDGRKLPVFTMQYYGAGRVLFHATDDTWRWRYRVGDVFFARYWVQAIRYLSRAKLLGKDRSAELSAERREYRRGDTARLRARFLDERLAPAEDDGVTVVVEREGRESQRIKLERTATGRGVFEAGVSGLLDGKYHAWIAAPTLPGKAPSADFVVTAPPGELERLQMDADELEQAAAETHGHFYRLPDVDRLVDELPLGRRVPIETLPPEVLWNRWWVLTAFVALAVGEWVLRKRKGML